MAKYTVTINVGGNAPYVFELDEHGATVLQDLLFIGKGQIKEEIINLLLQFLNVSLASLELSASSDDTPNYMPLNINDSLSRLQMISEVLTHSKPLA